LVAANLIVEIILIVRWSMSHWCVLAAALLQLALFWVSGGQTLQSILNAWYYLFVPVLILKC